MKLKTGIIYLFERAHQAVFGHASSPLMHLFIKNLSFSFIGIIVNSGILFGLNVIAGRVLGPNQFGNLSLVTALSSFLSVVMFAGYDASSVKFIAADQAKERQRLFINTSFWGVVLVSGVIFLLTIIFHSAITHLINGSTEVVILGATVGVFLTLKRLLDNVVRALSQFLYQAKVKIIEGLLALIIFAFFFFVLDLRTYQYYFAAIAGSSLIVIIMYLRQIRDYFSAWDRQTFKEMFNYQKLSILISIISIIISSTDKFFTAHYLGIYQLGLYSAYLMSSVLIIGQLVSALANVFFPAISQAPHKRLVVKKVDRLLLLGFLPGVIVCVILSFIVLKLFGSHYPIVLSYILVAALIAYFQVVVGFYGAIIASSESFTAYNTRLYIFKPVLIALLYYGIYYFQQITILNVLLVTAVTYIYDIASTRLTLWIVNDEG